MSEADAIRERVRAKYAAIARAASTGSCGPSSASCCADGSLDMIGDAYRAVAGHVAEADLGLGCGMPTRHAGLRPGETALDLDCGAGNDVFLARHEVGETGRVVGVDTTSEPIARVRANARKLGFDDVGFRLGEIEHLPVESGTFGCVISKCVSNLVPDEARAFAEIARVSKPGGRLRVSDVVATGRSARPRLSGWVASPGPSPCGPFAPRRGGRARGGADRRGPADPAAGPRARRASRRRGHRRLPRLGGRAPERDAARPPTAPTRNRPAVNRTSRKAL